MSIHSYTKIWIHLIWETLSREKLLVGDSGMIVSEFLFDYAKNKNIFMKVNYVNPEHVHVLFELPTNMNIEDCTKLFKGASSHFINDKQIIKGKFNWGRGYAAFSVSESQVDKVIKYIKNQKEHHKIKTFEEEYKLFLNKYKISYK